MAGPAQPLSPLGESSCRAAAAVAAATVSAESALQQKLHACVACDGQRQALSVLRNRHLHEAHALHNVSQRGGKAALQMIGLCIDACWGAVAVGTAERSQIHGLPGSGL